MRASNARLIVAVNLILIIGFYSTYVSRSYPLIGHDYRYFVPRLLDTYLHYRLNGLGIQWYTPSFGGGLPAYPNPQHIQYSLPQVLLFVVNPWQAVIISMIVFMTAGYMSVYYLCRHLIGLHWTASILGALFFVLNGFYVQHLSVGHLTYVVFPIFVLIIVMLLHPAISNALAGVIISLLVAVTIYNGAFYVAVAYTLSILITLPLLYLLRPGLFAWRSILMRLGWAIPLSLLLTGSKIYAVTSFMRQFPRATREVFDVSILRGITGILAQLLGTTNLGPLFYVLMHRISNHFWGFKIQGDNGVQWLLQRIFRTYYSIWETDISVSPGVWILLGIGIVLLIRQMRLRKLHVTRGKILAGLILLVSIWLTIQFVLGKGLIYSPLSRLIFLRSLHTNIRYTVAFVLPLSILASYIFDQLEKIRPKFALSLFWLLDILTFVALSSYFLTAVAGYSFDVSHSVEVYRSIQSGSTYPVREIAKVPDAEAIPTQASSLEPYEVIFGYNLHDFFPKVKPGPADETNGQFFNMTNPASLVYPGPNDLTLFERIVVNDRANLDLFLQRRQPHWKLPLIQQVADWLALLTFAFEAVVAAIFLYRWATGSHTTRRNDQVK